MADQLISGTTLIEDKRRAVSEVWSCGGSNFIPQANSTQAVEYGGDNGDGLQNKDGGTINVFAYVTLPNGVEVTGAIVYGNGVETWTLKRSAIDNSASEETMATAAIDTEDITISNETINNSSYRYFLEVTNLADDGYIHGARIKYK
jgi:hypothetical protein